MASLASIGQNPDMAKRIMQALIESTGSSGQPTQMPAKPAQQHPDQSTLQAPGNSFVERLMRGENMPFDVGGSVKSGINLAKGALKKARLTKVEADFFETLNTADIAQLREFVPSVKLLGPRDPELPATALQVAEKDLPRMFKYLDEMRLSESRAVGGPGASTLPPTFSQPQLLLDRFR
tara:strand:- start:1283 stop:1819 length:537 start_codon:yes stop_codon:yes gene_type:complete